MGFREHFVADYGFQAVLGHEIDAVTQDLGNGPVKGIVQCNLGMACEGLDRPQEARRFFRDALDTARDVGDSRLEGQILGYLGLLHARQGEVELACECLVKGDALLRALDDRASLGILLCARAEAEQLARQTGLAQLALAEARSVAAAIAASSGSEFGLALERAEAAVNAGTVNAKEGDR